MVAAAADSCTIKFLCSYNGIIAPRPADGLLRYYGGLTRVLAVHRRISYAELMVKLVEFCGFSVDLKCALPHGDLETLVTIKSEEELANLLEEYDDRASPSKIRAVLITPPKSLKRISPSNSSDDVVSSYNYRPIGSRSRVVCQRSDDDDDDEHYSPPPPPPPPCIVDDDFYCPKSCCKYSSTRSSSLCQQYYTPDWSRISSPSGNYYYYNPKAVDRFSCCRIPMRRRRRSYCDVIGSAAPAQGFLMH